MARALSRVDAHVSRVPLSIIIPCLNEARVIAPALDALASLRARGAEVIVVDGGSSDDSVVLARPRADRVMTTSRGRGLQMNAGAAHAHGDVLLFLHADSRLPDHADVLIAEALAASGRTWGRFDIAITGASILLPLIAALMNLRSRLTGIATGDQGIFVTRRLFEQVGRFPEIALMEDIALSAVLRNIGPPLCVRDRVTTSGRRWERHGVLRTMLLMWRLRLAYWRGAHPDELALRYASHDRP